MKKAIKHILFLCVLLLMSNNSLFANTLATIKPVSSIQDKSSKTNLQDFSFDIYNIITPTQDFNFGKNIVIDSEEEVSEVNLSNKQLEKTAPYLSYYNTHSIDFLSDYTNSLVISFCKEFFYLPTYTSLYLIFEVFRI